jgi:hypothetical protein
LYIFFTNLQWARVVGYGPFPICVIHKKGVCPSSGDINGLMMMIFFYQVDTKPILISYSNVGTVYIICMPLELLWVDIVETGL